MHNFAVAPGANARRWPLPALAATLLLLVAAAPAAAGALRFDRVDERRTLSQVTALTIHQDERGFLWVGTEDGLNRFDGYDFTVFTHRPDDPRSLPGNWIWAIADDGSGGLWIGTEDGGLGHWDAATDSFSRYRHDPDDPTSLASDQIRCLEVDAQGQLWIGTRDAGLDRFDPATERFTHFRHDDGDPASLGHDSVSALLAGADGALWVGTERGVDRLEQGATTFSQPLAAALESEEPLAVRSLLEAADGDLWIGTSKSGLLHFDRPSGEVARYRHDAADPGSLGGNRVLALVEDDAGRLWVGTNGGLSQLDRENQSLITHRHDPADPTTVGSDDVMSLYQDRGGILWIGTRTAGVSKWNPLTLQFGHRTAGPAELGGLSVRDVTAFTEDLRGDLWIGTFGGGVNVRDRLTGAVRHVRHDGGRGLTSDRISSLLCDRYGRVWVGTFDGGLNRWDPESQSFTVFRHDPKVPRSLASDAVTTLFEDSSGRLWVGTYRGGLHRFEPRSGTFTVFRHDENDPRSLASDIITALAEDVDGSLWVGTEGGGLNLLDPRSGHAISLRQRRDDGTSLPADSVMAVHVDVGGTVWVGTRGGGLARLLERPTADGGGRFQTYAEREGLPNRMVYGIHSDRAGRLWMSTNRGLASLDPTTGEFVSYRATHGLQADEFHFGSHYQNGRGELFFGGVDGFNAFTPERLRRNDNPPEVLLTAVLEYNRPMAGLGPPAAIDRLDLGHRDDVVTFEFAALDFADPAQNRYAYRLEGFDEAWIDLGEVHRVTFTNLDAGSYVFRVRAANSDGVWNKEGLALPVVVEAAPWLTGWAYGGYGLFGLGMVFTWVGVSRRRLEREERYSRQLEQEVAERTEELVRRAEQLEQLNVRLGEASLTDSLTGLANRRFVFQFLDKEVALVQRRHAALSTGTLSPESLNLVFIMIDFDDFKRINDTWGHQVGDEVLVQMRPVLEEACRSSDILIRWGGDEFLVVARESQREGIEALVERIRRQLEIHPFHVGDGQVMHTTCSLGFACYPFLGDHMQAVSWEQVIGIADRALYAAKRNGRNRWLGLFGTPTTPREGLVAAIRGDLGELVAEGQVLVRSSVDDLRELSWH
jgi:diguanylate cyclase (GGDEF)-like protein